MAIITPHKINKNSLMPSNNTQFIFKFLHCLKNIYLKLILSLSSLFNLAIRSPFFVLAVVLELVVLKEYRTFWICLFASLRLLSPIFLVKGIKCKNVIRFRFIFLMRVLHG